MNALQQNTYTDAWRRLGESLPTPRAILVISAHWFVPGTRITAMPRPKTIHDFAGFPQALFDFRYPAPGDPELAKQISALLKPLDVSLDNDWGLDHGAWSVLAHIFPKANIPVLQLSIDSQQAPAFHYALGKKLNPLRHQGIFILASGNVVHNLGVMNWRKSNYAYDWADRFNKAVHACLLKRDHDPLIHYTHNPDAALAVPTAEHYLPLLYVLGQHGPETALKVLVDGIAYGSLGMLSLLVDH